MKKAIGWFSLVLLLNVHLAAQELSIRGGNLLRWARGDAYLQGSSNKVRKNWFENITDLCWLIKICS